MNDEEKKIQEAILPWRFRLYTVISLLIITVVVYYLPTRFLYNSSLDSHHEDTTAQPSALPSLRDEVTITDGLSINLTHSPSQLETRKPIQFSFFVNQKPAGTPITDLVLEHTKLMHVIGMRDDLNGFFHIHPTQTAPGTFSVEHILQEPGKYKIWSQVTRGGQDYTVAHPMLTVVGKGTSPVNKNINYTRTTSADQYVVSISYAAPMIQKGATSITFFIETASGDPVDLADYLGVPMHLAVVKEDLSEFIHTHPANHDHAHVSFIPEAFAHGDEPTTQNDTSMMHDDGSMMMTMPMGEGIPFNVIFPSPGNYKIFGQFHPKGSALPEDEAITASFWIKVLDH